MFRREVLLVNNTDEERQILGSSSIQSCLWLRLFFLALDLNCKKSCAGKSCSTLFSIRDSRESAEKIRTDIIRNGDRVSDERDLESKRKRGVHFPSLFEVLPRCAMLNFRLWNFICYRLLKRPSSKAARSGATEAYPRGYVARRHTTENDAGDLFQQPSRLDGNVHIRWHTIRPLLIRHPQLEPVGAFL